MAASPVVGFYGLLFPDVLYDAFYDSKLWMDSDSVSELWESSDCCDVYTSVCILEATKLPRLNCK